MKILLASAIPGAVWLLLIYLTIPHHTIRIKDATKFFIAGVAATAFVGFFLGAFPDYYEVPQRTDLDVFRLAFARISPLEEAIKILLFVWAASALKNAMHPSALLAYGAIVGLGFAMVENVTYGQQYGVGVVILRSITSTILHVGCGIVFAWFYLWSIYIKRFPRTRLELLFNKMPGLRQNAYQILGVAVCVFIHGYYDYILIGKQPFGNSVFFLVLLVTTTWGMAKFVQKQNVNNFTA